LYAKNLSVAEEDLTLSSIVMPVPLADTTPPKPEPIQKIEKKLSASSDKPQVAIRNQNVARIDETQPIPDKISTQPSNVKSRPNTLYKIAQGKETDYVGQTSSRNSNNEGETSGISNSKQNDKVSKNEIDEPPPIVKKKVEEKTKVEEKVKVEEKTKVPNKVSGGVLNGKAISLPKPNYSATAKAVGASGDVQVQVLIDERGNVVSANAISGSPLLRPDAEKAARQAKFSPTYLSDQAVKVSGLIVYRFTK
jgi:protein TonB